MRVVRVVRVVRVGFVKEVDVISKLIEGKVPNVSSSAELKCLTNARNVLTPS
jgi:hypothetical protein